MTNILTHIDQACGEAEEADTLVIQFSGHGAMADGRLRLLAADTSLKFLDRTSVSWAWVVDRLGESKAGRKVLVVDACHAGAGKDPGQARTLSAGVVNALKQRPGGFVCLSACTEGELAYESEELGHGIFSYHLKGGIAGAADRLRRGVIDVEEPFHHAREKTAQPAWPRAAGAKARGVRGAPAGWRHGAWAP
jgi:uncharacterized caspase-like protein